MVKRLFLILCVIAFPRKAWTRQITIEAGYRYGYCDTGFEYKRLLAPCIGFGTNINKDKSIEIGVDYVNWHWNDQSIWEQVGPAKDTDGPTRLETEGKAHWDAIFLRFGYSYKISERYIISIVPKFGFAFAKASGWHVIYGGWTRMSKSSYDTGTVKKLGFELNPNIHLKISESFSTVIGFNITKLGLHNRELDLRSRYMESIGRFVAIQYNVGVRCRY